MSTAQVDSNSPASTAKRLTSRDREAIIAACAAGGIKRNIAKEFGIRPETISRVLRAVKQVQRESNPLSTSYKPTLREKSVQAIIRGLDSKRDPYAAANIAVKVMSGIGEFVSGTKVDVQGDVSIVFRWQQEQVTPGDAQDIDVEHKAISE